MLSSSKKIYTVGRWNTEHQYWMMQLHTYKQNRRRILRIPSSTFMSCQNFTNPACWVPLQDQSLPTVQASLIQYECGRMKSSSPSHRVNQPTFQTPLHSIECSWISRYHQICCSSPTTPSLCIQVFLRENAYKD